MSAPLKQMKRQVTTITVPATAGTARPVLVPVNASRITRIRYHANLQVTGTLTAEAFARTPAGGTGVTLQSAATNLVTALNSLANARAGVAAALAAQANRLVAAGSFIEIVLTGTPNAHDLLVVVDYEDRGS